LKGLLVEKKIVSYTMVSLFLQSHNGASPLTKAKQHNTSATKSMITPIYGDLPSEKIADCDCFVQIVFRDLEHYLEVRRDPHFTNVVGPDHDNFADGARTKFVTGWFEVHVADGKLV
jgi:hypothetical protein